MNSNNAPTIISTVIILAQIVACIAFPAYRELCMDIAFWGWNQIF